MSIIAGKTFPYFVESHSVTTHNLDSFPKLHQHREVNIFTKLTSEEDMLIQHLYFLMERVQQFVSRGLILSKPTMYGMKGVDQLHSCVQRFSVAVNQVPWYGYLPPQVVQAMTTYIQEMQQWFVCWGRSRNPPVTEVDRCSAINFKIKEDIKFFEHTRHQVECAKTVQTEIYFWSSQRSIWYLYKYYRLKITHFLKPVYIAILQQLSIHAGSPLQI